MPIPNHAPGFAHQWGRPAWVDEADLEAGLWSDVEDEEPSDTADPLLILIAAEEAGTSAPVAQRVQRT